MIVESWFPTLIFYAKASGTEQDNELLAKRAYQLKEEQQSKVTTEWHCDTFNTMQLHPDVYYRDDKIDRAVDQLKDFTTPLVHGYAKLFDADLENFNIVCNDFWFNIAEPGAYQEFHQHPNNHFSVVYYVKAKPKSGNIVFKSFESICDTCTIPTKQPVSSQGALKTTNYIPEPGKILIFRSNLLHMVEKNLSGEDRISVAMNFQMVPKT
jgi:uncharacterized protein (TIGR02466 family)